MCLGKRQINYCLLLYFTIVTMRPYSLFVIDIPDYNLLTKHQYLAYSMKYVHKGFNHHIYTFDIGYEKVIKSCL